MDSAMAAANTQECEEREGDKSLEEMTLGMLEQLGAAGMGTLCLFLRAYLHLLTLVPLRSTTGAACPQHRSFEMGTGHAGIV